MRPSPFGVGPADERALIYERFWKDTRSPQKLPAGSVSQTYRETCIAEAMVSTRRQSSRATCQLSSKARVRNQCSSALPSGQPSRSQCVGALAEALMLRLMPEFFCAAIRPTRPLPEQIGALANDLI
jgi:hypothetical protein